MMLRRSTAPMTPMTLMTLTLLLLIAAALSTGASAQRSATGLASRLTKRPGSSSSSLSSSSSGGSTKSSAESDSESGESSSFQWEELAGTPGSGIGALMALVAGGYYALFVSQSSHPRREVVKFGAHDDEEEDEEEIVIEDDARMDRGFLKNVEIGFSDIRMTLKQKKKKKEDRIILDGSIRGKARPGRMLAIMGPSGSGKSTLVHALAGRIKDSSRVRLHGSRYVNGAPVAGDSQLPSAFIEQDVTFFPHMTVKETLDFRVELRLGKKIGPKREGRRRARIDGTIGIDGEREYRRGERQDSGIERGGTEEIEHRVRDDLESSGNILGRADVR
uniref:ABC transporter domain-containing protein n=1 Tax=Odontella aurita TaxID=265563 RepID=A0A7S4ICV1_9STRA|mmetsp:Transcript_23137/g.68258  ORF Transcript_23137/g.68258 Transcript_23137/m.68258 type:complete len:333 (+) Transcript_23137:492-1490(+)